MILKVKLGGEGKSFQDGRYLEGLYAERRDPEEEGLEIEDRKTGK